MLELWEDCLIQDNASHGTWLDGRRIVFGESPQEPITKAGFPILSCFVLNHPGVRGLDILTILQNYSNSF